MRILHLLTALTVICLTTAAPSKSKFETGSTSSESQPFVEEVVVESVLHVRAPADRQGRTTTNTSLQDGARVVGAKP